MPTRTIGAACYDSDAPRKAVNLSINGDLLLQAKRLTKNLSATVEALLAGHVQAELARKRADDEALEQVITALNAYHEEHGFLSDEFQSF